MIDQIYDRQYRSGRAEFHDGIDRLVKQIGASLADTFRAVERVQFDAPWKARSAAKS